MVLDALIVIGVVAGSIATTITSVTLVGRLRPVRWLIRIVIVQPGERWLRGLIADVVDERLDARPLTNGWGAATVHAIANEVGADVPAPHTHHKEDS